MEFWKRLSCVLINRTKLFCNSCLFWIVGRAWGIESILALFFTLPIGNGFYTSLMSYVSCFHFYDTPFCLNVFRLNSIFSACLMMTLYNTEGIRQSCKSKWVNQQEYYFSGHISLTRLLATLLHLCVCCSWHFHVSGFREAVNQNNLSSNRQISILIPSFPNLNADMSSGKNINVLLTIPLPELAQTNCFQVKSKKYSFLAKYWVKSQVEI